MNSPIQKYAIFWGCNIPLRLPWIEKACRVVLPKLGVEIVDLLFSCCPDPVASKSLDRVTWLALAARNLSLAEEQNLNILSMCSGCFGTLKSAREAIQNPETKKEINKILGQVNRQVKGSVQVFHVQQWLMENVGIESLSEKIVRPLKGKVATHTGCHYTRPSEILQTDDPVYPRQLDELCEAMGLESVDYPDKNLCCGTGAGLTDRPTAYDLIKRKMIGAQKANAEALVAHCPSCILSYDSGQQAVLRKVKQVIKPLPVFHLIELLGLAMGIQPEELAFEDHAISVDTVLKRIINSS